MRFGRSLGAGSDMLSALSVARLQLDDLSLFTPYPVMLAHDPDATPFLDLLLTQRGTAALNTLNIPFVGVGMDCGTLQLRLTESSMWKLFLAGKAFVAALTANQAAPEVLVLVDPTIEVSALMTPALSALVWFNAENASQEALGTGTSLSLPNVERTPLDLRPIMLRDEKMAQSKLVENLANNIKKQIVGQVRQNTHRVQGLGLGLGQGVRVCACVCVCVCVCVLHRSRVDASQLEPTSLPGDLRSSGVPPTYR